MQEKSWLKAFSARLNEVIKESGLTQKTLAIMAGLSEGTISNYIHGRKMPNARAIVNLSYALNCPVEYLIDFGYPIY